MLHGATVRPTIEKQLGQEKGHSLYQRVKAEGKNITRNPAICIGNIIIASELILTDREK